VRSAAQCCGLQDCGPHMSEGEWGKPATARFGGGAALRSMKIDGGKGQSGLRKFGWEAGRGCFAAE
jgi:hypothetical protein